MEDRVIAVTKHGDHSWLVECPCGFFCYRGTHRMNNSEAMFRAQREAKRHNQIGHRKTYRVSTEGSEFF